ncbi:MAG: hypothetical protein WDN06_15235 [Asticcacaulis sp.]
MVVTSLCLALVWGGLMGRDMHDILPYIMCGIVCFQLVAFAFNDGPELFLGSGSMIKNHANPYSYYVAETVCRSVLTFAHNVLIFFVVEACVMAFAIPHWTFLLGFPIVVVTIFCWGTVAGLVAARFRDPSFRAALYLPAAVLRHADHLAGRRHFHRPGLCLAIQSAVRPARSHACAVAGSRAARARLGTGSQLDGDGRYRLGAGVQPVPPPHSFLGLVHVSHYQPARRGIIVSDLFDPGPLPA